MIFGSVRHILMSLIQTLEAKKKFEFSYPLWFCSPQAVKRPGFQATPTRMPVVITQTVRSQGKLLRDLMSLVHFKPTKGKLLRLKCSFSHARVQWTFSSIITSFIAGAVGTPLQVRSSMGIAFQASANQKQKLNDPGGGTFRLVL